VPIRRPRRFAVTAAAALGSAVALAAPASAGPGETAFAIATNTLRASYGRAPYAVCPDLTAVADQWAAHMAADQTLEHNPDLTGEVANWDGLGENVGFGPSEAALMAAYIASPAHLANLVSPSYTEVGFGTAIDSHGTMWSDEVFRTPSGAGCAAAAVIPAVSSVVHTVAEPLVGFDPATSAADTTSTAALQAFDQREALLRGLDTASRSEAARTALARVTASRQHLAAALAHPSAVADPVGQAFAFVGTVTRVVS